MVSNNDDDSQQRFVLGFLFALIALLVSAVVGVVVYQRGIHHAAPPAPVAAGGVLEEVASVRVENGVVKFFFATNSAEVAQGAAQALAEVALAATQGRRVAVSGFHDETGNAAQNAELAKQRALAVREAIKSLGVAEEVIELRKPEVSTGSGTQAEARRVEVIVLP